MIKYIFNKIVLYTISLIILISSIDYAQSFEGLIKFKMKSDDHVISMDYFMNKDNLRIEFGNQKEAVFIKNKDKSMVLMPGQKMYMDLDNSIFDRIKNMMGKKEVKKEKKEFDIEKYRTGKTKTIHGYKCSQWIFKDENDDEDTEIEAWVTDELGNFMLMKSPMGGGFSPGWSNSLKNNGYFPLLVITRDEDGNEISRFEATEISKRTLQSSLFNPPADFEEMKMPGF